MKKQTFTCNASSETKERRRYERISFSCIVVGSCGILASSVHEKAAVRSVGQEVVTIDDYNGSGEFDTTWEKVEF